MSAPVPEKWQAAVSEMHSRVWWAGYDAALADLREQVQALKVNPSRGTSALIMAPLLDSTWNEALDEVLELLDWGES